MKLTDMIISAIIKKGVLYEARNCDIVFDVPTAQDTNNGVFRNTVKVTFKAEHMSLRVEKE